MSVFFFVFLTYFAVVSGLMYDVILQPPSMGSMQDPYTGQVRPVAFALHRINAQYIIEGLTAGVMFIAGGLGFILLDAARAPKYGAARTQYNIMVAAGLLFLVLAYNLLMVFTRIKMPHFMK